MFGDLDDFRMYGSLFLSGVYFPRYPLPIMGWFVLLSLLPRDVAIAGLIVASLVMLVILFRRRAVLWIFYVPILQCLAAGNLDVLFLGLLMRSSPASLALLTLKPQLFLFALPTLIKRRALWRPFLAWSALLWLPPTVLYPQWLGQWLRGANDGRIEQGTSASLWPVPILALTLILLMIIMHRFNWRVIASSLNPLLRAYDYTMLAGASVWLVPLSWVCWLIMWRVYAAWPMALLGIALINPHIPNPNKIACCLHRYASIEWRRAA